MLTLTCTGISASRLSESGVFLQSGFWGEFKSHFGWQALPFGVRVQESDDGTVRDFQVLVLIRKIALFSIAYVPYPVLDSVTPYGATEGDFRRYTEILEKLSPALKPGLPSGCIFIRYDLPWSTTTLKALPAPAGRLRKAPMEIQPASTVVLDLREPEAALLSSMKPKTRYNIRLSEKKGVEIVEGSLADLEAWYGLYTETARRDRISLHGFGYYRQLFEIAGEQDPAGTTIRLLLAKAEGQLIAGIILLIHGSRATYLYGASSNEKRNFMPAYGLQWRAIRIAQDEGCLTYDMFGIPPSDDPDHPMAGLYRFKTGFGGTVLHRPGCWDFPLKAFPYLLYAAAERLRRTYHKNWKKRRPQQPGPDAPQEA